MIGTELEKWRRTHYSSQLSSKMTDKDVIVMGWVLSVRGHGNISFMMLKDKEGEIQVVA
jgi:aspartyl-tRNA synthetase